MSAVQATFTRGLALAAFVLALCLVPRAHASERVLALPLQPAEGEPYDGLGVALQNVIENTVVLNPGFEETFLLNHSRALFPTAGDLQAYMLGLRPPNFPLAGAKRDGTRYVLGGRIEPGFIARVWLADLPMATSYEADLPIDPQTGLLRFRRGLIEFLDQNTRLPFPVAQAAKAQAPEKTNVQALRTFGRSYGSYQVLSHAGAKDALDVDLARLAHEEAPGSYLAANMYGWVLTASGNQADGDALFREALKIDPNGVDALDGMVRSGLRHGGTDAAMPWALRKSAARGGTLGPVLSQVHMYLGFKAQEAKRVGLAAAHFATATRMDPEAVQPVFSLAFALFALGRDKAAQAALERLLILSPRAPLLARIQNARARLCLWSAYRSEKAGDPAKEKAALDQAVSLLTGSPLPDLHEYSLAMRREAQLAILKGNPNEAVRQLEAIRPEKGTDPLFVAALIAHARALGGEKNRSREDAALALDAVAERLRTREPVSAETMSTLEKTFELLEDAGAAESLKRQRKALQASPDNKE